jgi:RNA polymerase sigma-70 factor (ECF subfamily)
VEKIDAKKRLSEMIDAYQNLIYSICFHYTSDYFTAQDLTQETFLQAYRNLDKIEREFEKNWLCRTATNKCIDYNKSAGRRMTYLEDEQLDLQASDRRDPAQIVEEKETREMLAEACNSLKSPYDKIAYEHFCLEKSAIEIAGEKGLNLKTVQTQIYRARQMLQKKYRKAYRKEVS